jgi:hypothetical protein
MQSQDICELCDFNGAELGRHVCVVCMSVGRFGFYRVNYSEPLWTALAQAATSPQAAISSVDLAGEISTTHWQDDQRNDASVACGTMHTLLLALP